MGKGGFSGFPGGNMNNLVKQAQKFQKQMEDMKDELKNKEYEASAGGGVVTVKANGKKEIIELQIKPEVVDPEDVEMLQDLIITACNDVLKKAEEETNSEMQKLTGGMNIPGLF